MAMPPKRTTTKAFSASLGYGLNIKKKGAESAKPAAMGKGASAIFGGDSDSDEDDGTAANPAKGRSDKAGVNYMMMQEAAKNKSNKKTQQAWQTAVAEDATVFQYDEVYDSMEQSKTVEAMRRKEAKSADTRPKYIDALMNAAKQKKLQDELRDERQAQKEREREGAEFSDKDVFVTGAYKQKLIELKKAAEEERRKELEEAKNDVTKKGDLTDLYRNMYKNKLTGGSAYEGDGSGPAAIAATASTTATADAGPASEPKASDAKPSTDGDREDRRDRAPHDDVRRRDDSRENGAPHGDETSDGKRRDHDRDRRSSRSPRRSEDGDARHSRPAAARPPSRKRESEATAPTETVDPAKHARKATETDVLDAKARYLARKAAKGGRKLATFDA